MRSLGNNRVCFRPGELVVRKLVNGISKVFGNWFNRQPGYPEVRTKRILLSDKKFGLWLLRPKTNPLYYLRVPK